MISTLRSLFASTTGKVVAILVLIVIALAFALSDVGSNLGFAGAGNATIAKVGDESITSGEFRTALDNAQKDARRENPELDMRGFVRQGGMEMVLEQYIASYALEAYGVENGFAVSKAMVDDRIGKIPQATNALGEFDPDLLRALLAQNNLTEKYFRETLRREYFQEQLLDPARIGAAMNDKVVRAYAALEFARRTGDVALIPSAAYAPKKDPSKAVLDKFYADNRDRFSLPETRQAVYAVFDMSIVGDDAKPSDAEIRKYYKDNAKEFAARDNREFSQVIVAGKSAAEKLLADAKATSLEAAAEKAGFSVSKIAKASKEGLTSDINKAVADAAFAASDGGYASLARSDLGYHVIRVDSVEKLPARSLAEARPQIEATLTRAKEEEQLSSIIEDFENALDEGESVRDVAKTRKLTLKSTPAVQRNGTSRTNPDFRPDPVTGPVLQAIFQMEEEGDGSVIEIPTEGDGKRFAIVGLNKLNQSAPPPLADIRDAVIAGWKLDQGDAKAKAAADKVVKSARSGKSLAEAIAALDKQLPAPQRVSGTREELQAGQKDVSPALAVLLTMPVGQTKRADIPGNRGYFVLHLEKVEPGDVDANKDRLAAFKAQFGQAVSFEYERQLLTAMEDELDIERNQDAINELKSSLLGDGAV